MRHKPGKTRDYVLWGVILGVVATVLEAMVTSVGAPDYWATVGLHFGQIGLGGGVVGGLIGLALARRAQRRRQDRRARGLCVNCGYNLTGNVSGRCPECGTPVPDTSAEGESA